MSDISALNKLQRLAEEYSAVSKGSKVLNKLESPPIKTALDISPLGSLQRGYNLYNEYVNEPISQAADQIADTIVSGTTPLQGEDKKRFVEQNKPLVAFGAEMAIDPLNFVPIGKIGKVGEAAILGRKEAAQLFETAMKRAAEEGKSVGQVTSDMLLGKMPWKADMPSSKNLEQQRLMMRDILGHALMEKGGIADDKNLARTIRSGVETLASGFPSDKLMMVNPLGEISLKPDPKTVTSLTQNRGNYLGALATGAHTGDIVGMNIRADRLPQTSQTSHQLMGLVGHELEHGQDAAKYGVAKHALEQPFDSSVLHVPGNTLDWRIDRASKMHHIDSPNQTIEKTLLDRLAAGESIFPDLQQPVKRFTNDADEINRLNNLIQQDPSLKDKLDQSMKMYDLQQARPRFTKIRQGLK